MNFIIPLIFIGLGLVAIFYIRPKSQNDIMEVKFLKTKKISELNEIFSQMEQNGLGDDYREFVELKGKIFSENLINAPFSNKKVAYCESELIEVVKITERYKDSNGNYQTRTINKENRISNERSSQDIKFIDESSNMPICIELNASGCKLDIPKTFDRFEQKNNLRNYSYFNSFSMSRFGDETVGFKMVENTIEPEQDLYVIGEAYRVGNTIHIGKPMDNKKPFIISTKSEEELVNSSNQKAMTLLIGGIISIIVGIIFLVRLF